jgi:hypothetical protein
MMPLVIPPPNCPQCARMDKVTSVRVIYESGIREGDHSGVATSWNGSAVYGGKSRSQSRLSKRFSPPRKPTLTAVIIIFLIGLGWAGYVTNLIAIGFQSDMSKSGRGAIQELQARYYKANGRFWPQEITKSGVARDATPAAAAFALFIVFGGYPLVVFGFVQLLLWVLPHGRRRRAKYQNELTDWRKSKFCSRCDVTFV